MERIVLKQNDTGSGRRATLSNENGAIDLTNASVLFLFGGHEITPVEDDPVNGKVLLVFEKIHTSTPGVFKSEFEVKFSDGRVETFPNNDYIQVHIIKDIGGR